MIIVHAFLLPKPDGIRTRLMLTTEYGDKEDDVIESIESKLHLSRSEWNRVEYEILSCGSALPLKDD